MTIVEVVPNGGIAAIDGLEVKRAAEPPRSTCARHGNLTNEPKLEKVSSGYNIRQ